MLCQICLKSKKKLVSITTLEHGISYEFMLSYVADIKIEKPENDSICLHCRRKLRELYDFKTVIRNSILAQSNYGKRIIFNNIREIQSDMLESYLDKKSINILKDLTDYFPDLNIDNEVKYGGTTIKIIKQPILETVDSYNIMKLETLDYNDFDDVDTELETDALEETKENNNTDQTTNKLNSKLSKKITRIRPVYLKDYRVLKTFNKSFEKKTKKQYPSSKREKRIDICPYCGKATKHMKSHILLHTEVRKFKCTQCNKKFYKEIHLMTHMKSHLLENSYKCNHCVAVFNKKGTLIKHMSIHQDIKEHACTICGKAFKWKTALRRHMLIHFPSAKSVACELCSMTFISKYGLRHHMRVHTGERPYKCELCSQPYSYKHDFNRHCFKKHGIFMKRRSINVMNEEVLAKERAFMEEIILSIKALHKGEEFVNPFTGPQAAQAFELALKQLQNNGQLPSGYI